MMKSQSKKTIYLALFGFQLLFLLIAFVITLVRGESISSIFSQTVSLLPIFIFLLIGIVSGFLIAHLIRLPVFQESYNKVLTLILGSRLGVFDYFIIALMSGVFEEILFRGVLQPMWGIWITSIVFVLVHGYFNPFNRKTIPSALLVMCITLALGGIYIYYGLIPAIAFHFGLDFAEMLRIRALAGKNTNKS
ncbi:CPBP family intramembrane glutamic endopeptidase [Chloroflexota bacterium]